MSKISVTTIAGLTSGGDANKVIIESGDTLQVDSNATVGGTAAITGNTTVGGTLGVTGETTLATHLNLGDNDRIKVGAGSDIQIYHDGSYSRIMESGGTALVLDTTSADIRLTADNSEVMGKFVKNGAVQLFHDNSQMFSTTARGINSLSETTGIARYGCATTVTLADDAQLNITNNGIAGSYIVTVYERNNGVGGSWFVTFRGGPTLLASGISGDCSASDVDGDLCLISSSGSHTVYLKNRLGASKELFISILAGNIGSS